MCSLSFSLSLQADTRMHVNIHGHLTDSPERRVDAVGPSPWGTPLRDSRENTVPSQFSRPAPGAPPDPCLRRMFQISWSCHLAAATAPAGCLLLFGAGAAPSSLASVRPPWAQRGPFLLWSERSSQSESGCDCSLPQIRGFPLRITRVKLNHGCEALDRACGASAAVLSA